MVLDMPPTTYIAQVYSCDVYGGAEYNACPTDSTSSSSTSSSGGGSTSSSSSNSSTSSSSDDTTTPSTTSTDGNTSTETGGYQTNTPETTSSPADAVAGMSWWLIIGIAVAIAVVGAWLIMLFKRRRRDNQIPPSPPIMPGGPTSPF